MAEWRENQIPTLVDKPEHWTMHFDGSLKLDGGGAGVLFISPQGEQLKYVLQILWEVSNNEAEYEALLHGLRLVISLGICYRDNLTGPKDGPRATWAEGNHCNSLQIGLCANVSRARMAVYLRIV
jgi:hypothetical protein